MPSTIVTINVSAIMSKSVLTAHPEETVYAASKRMAAKNIGSIVIIDKDRAVLGIFTERDLMNRVVARDKDVRKTPLKNVMTHKPIAIKSTNTIAAAHLLFKGSGFRHVPVVDKKKKLIGVISIKDVHKAAVVR